MHIISVHFLSHIYAEVFEVMVMDGIETILTSQLTTTFKSTSCANPNHLLLYTFHTTGPASPLIPPLSSSPLPMPPFTCLHSSSLPSSSSLLRTCSSGSPIDCPSLLCFIFLSLIQGAQPSFTLSLSCAAAPPPRWDAPANSMSSICAPVASFLSVELVLCALKFAPLLISPRSALCAPTVVTILCSCRAVIMKLSASRSRPYRDPSGRSRWVPGVRASATLWRRRSRVN